MLLLMGYRGMLLGREPRDKERRSGKWFARSKGVEVYIGFSIYIVMFVKISK